MSQTTKDLDQAKYWLEEMAANNAIEGMPLSQDRLNYFTALIDQGVDVKDILALVMEEYQTMAADKAKAAGH